MTDQEGVMTLREVAKVGDKTIWSSRDAISA